MITVEKSGKIYIPPEDGFIGYAGDNLNKTIEILLKERNQKENFYRIYLKFDDETVNYFIVQMQIKGNDTILNWNITDDHIFKSGVVYLQIKGFNASKEVFHTESVPLIVGNSIEFGNYFAEKQISEFLEKEKELNELYSDIENAKKFIPYIGENGNWFIYDYTSKKFVDSNITAKGSAEKYPIETTITAAADNSHVPSSKAVYDLVSSQKNVYSPYVSRLLNADGDLIRTISENTITYNSTYSNNSALTYLYISPRVTSIGINSFSGCNNLKTVVIYNSENGINVAENAFPITAKIIYMYSDLPQKNKDNIDFLSTQTGNLSYLNTRDKTSLVNSINELNTTHNDLKTEIENSVLKTDMFDIGVSVAYDANMNILATQSNNLLTSGSNGMYKDGTVYAYIPSKVTRLQSGAINYNDLKLLVIDNREDKIDLITANIPESVKVIYTKKISDTNSKDIVPVVLMKMAYANSAIKKNISNLTTKAENNEEELSNVKNVLNNKEDILNKISSSETLITDPHDNYPSVSYLQQEYYNREDINKMAEKTSNKTDIDTTTNSTTLYPSLQLLHSYYYNYSEIDDFLKDKSDKNTTFTKTDCKLRYNPTLTVAFDENDVVIKTFAGTAIEVGEFTENKRIKKVFIPSNVRDIRGGAFVNCTNLEEIIIDNVEGQVNIYQIPSGEPGGSIPAYVNVIYTDTFNTVDVLCNAVKYLGDTVSELSEKIQTINNVEAIKDKEV